MADNKKTHLLKNCLTS